jgi:HK97 family phage portal protein
MNWFTRKWMERKALNSVPSVPMRMPTGPELLQIGRELTVYPQDAGERYVSKGYQLNDAVYSICSKNAEKAGQVRLYHMKVKRSEQKTREEYLALQKAAITQKSLMEMNRMRKAMTEDRVADSPLAKLLNKPNRNETQGMWIERLFLFRELQGEGNIWLSRLDGGRPLEMFSIPKPQLSLVGTGADPWQILAFKFNLSGNVYRWDPKDVMMWKYTNPVPVDNTLEHLRGLAPLAAFIVSLQGMNEADLRLATSNKNGGASGVAYRKDTLQVPTLEQAATMRKQFNDAVNSSDMVNKIAILAGEWGFFNLAMSVEQQKLLEQYGVGFKRLCRVFKTPAEIFGEGNDTYENQRQYKRSWIYDKIAPNVYQLRDMLSAKLLREFDLDPETNMIDCDIMSLPEMAEDLKDLIAAVKDAWWLTPNQKLDATGYEKSNDPNMEKIYIPNGFSPMDQVNMDIGGNLDAEQNLLSA